MGLQARALYDYQAGKFHIDMYEGKSLNNRNFILKCIEKYAQWKILFRDTKWLLSNMSYRGRDDQAVWTCAVGRTTWPLHCQLALWKSNEALFVFCGQRVWNLLKSTEEWRFSMAPSDFHLFGPILVFILAWCENAGMCSMLVCLVSSTLICTHPSAIWDYRHMFSVTDRLVSSTVTCVHPMIWDCNVMLSVTVRQMNSTVVQSVLSHRPQQWFRWQFLIQQLIVQCVPPGTLSEVRNMLMVNVAQLIPISYGTWKFFAMFTRAATEPYYCQFERNSLLFLQSTIDGVGWSTPRPCRFIPERDPVPIV